MGNTAESFLLNNTSPVSWSITNATLDLSSSTSSEPRRPSCSPRDKWGTAATRNTDDLTDGEWEARDRRPLLLTLLLALLETRTLPLARKAKRCTLRASSRLSLADLPVDALTATLPDLTLRVVATCRRSTALDAATRCFLLGADFPEAASAPMGTIKIVASIEQTKACHTF